MKAFTYLILLTVVAGCSASKKADDKDQARAQLEREFIEDSERPFVPLLTNLDEYQVIEFWHPREQSSIWTPKGDAVFTAGEGARVNVATQSVEFISKNKTDARVYSLARGLSAQEWASFEILMLGLNRVATNETRTCPSSFVETHDSISLRSEAKTTLIFNYRRASCSTDLTDSLSFQKVFDWIAAVKA